MSQTIDASRDQINPSNQAPDLLFWSRPAQLTGACVVAGHFSGRACTPKGVREGQPESGFPGGPERLGPPVVHWTAGRELGQVRDRANSCY